MSTVTVSKSPKFGVRSRLRAQYHCLEKDYKEGLTVKPLGVSSRGAYLNEQVMGSLIC